MWNPLCVDTTRKSKKQDHENNEGSNCVAEIYKFLSELEWVVAEEDSTWNKMIKEKIKYWKKHIEKYTNCELRLVDQEYME